MCQRDFANPGKYQQMPITLTQTPALPINFATVAMFLPSQVKSYINTIAHLTDFKDLETKWVQGLS